MPWRRRSIFGTWGEALLLAFLIGAIIYNVGVPFKLFSPISFSSRANGGCGGWTRPLGWLHNTSDLLIFLAYIVIPICILRATTLKIKEIPSEYHWVALSFMSFILACGLTHLMAVITFFTPIYRIDGLIKAWTAFVSWMTVAGFLRLQPELLRIARVIEHRPFDDSQADDDANADVARQQQGMRDKMRALVDADKDDPHGEIH